MQILHYYILSKTMHNRHCNTILRALCAAGMDYVAGFFSITIVPSSAPVCVNITILSDNLIEDAEYFSLHLTGLCLIISHPLPSCLSVVSIAGETGECVCVCVCMCVCARVRVRVPACACTHARMNG